MNKKRFFLGLILCLVSMFIGAVVGYLVANNVDFGNADDYVKNTILPVILGSGTGGGIFAIAMTLILNSLKVATTQFGTSSDRFDKAQKLLEAQNNKIIEQQKTIESYQESLANITDEVWSLKKMVEVGLCNTSELVSSGVATEIKKISEGENENKDQT